MGQIEVFSPAKINLFLAVVGRRDDGFHELLSLVAPLDFGDRLRVEVSESTAAAVELECDDPALPTDSRNLAYAAAAAFLQRFDLRLQARLRLEKCIPYGAGLGGGSSNAAATLRSLAALTGRGTEGELAQLAAQLGSDCPLFLRAKPTILRGRGERLEALLESAVSGLKGRSVLLFKPSFSISTPWAYGALARTPESYADEGEAERRLERWQAGELSLNELQYNSFQTIVWRKYTAMAVMEQRLRDAGMRMLLSGSGSCCFILPRDAGEAERATLAIRRDWGETAFVQSAKLL